jgi:hypothetical protein
MKQIKFLTPLIFGIILFLTTPHVFSQDVSFSEGKEFINKNGTFKYVIGEDRSSFYVLRLGTKGSGVQNNVEKYDKKTFQLEWVKDVAFETDLNDKIPSGDQFLKSSVILSRGKIYFFLSLLEPRKNTRSVYVKTLNTANGEVLGKALLLASEENFKGTEKFVLSFSQDTTMVLIKSVYTTYIGQPTTRYEKVKLFDLKTNQEIFTKEMPTSDVNGKLECTSVNVDNNGNLLCIYSHTSGDGAPGVGKIPVNSTQMNSFDLNIGVNDHAYLISNNLQYNQSFDYAVITGVFIDIPCKSKKNCERKEGAFFMKIDLNKSKVISAEYQYYDDKIHNQYKGLFDSMDDYKRLYCISSIIDKKNDDVYNISVGYLEAIFVTRFNKDGKVVWTKVLPRKGVNVNSAFAYAFENGKLYFIYLDHPKNMEGVNINDFSVKDVKGLSAVTGANVISMSIDKDGELTRTLLNTNERDSANFSTDTYDYLSGQPPIYNLKNRDKEKFIRFEFKK